MKKNYFLLICIVFIISVLSSCKKSETEEAQPAVEEVCKDGSGNVYKTVKIGNQIWMAENLRTTKFSTGDNIPEVKDNTAWAILTQAGYCNYQNTTNETEIATYGRIYNYASTIDNRNICPTGWHVPTATDWTNLITVLGGNSVAGGKLKATGTTYWTTPNAGATNESAFNAIAAGAREPDGNFGYRKYYDNYWTSTPNPAVNGNAWTTILYYDKQEAVKYSNNMKVGMSIRCIKN